MVLRLVPMDLDIELRDSESQNPQLPLAFPFALEGWEACSALGETLAVPHGLCACS